MKTHRIGRHKWIGNDVYTDHYRLWLETIDNKLLNFMGVVCVCVKKKRT